ncbi:group XIIA secretory phospholipase A2-like [Dendronephthya gigantea]|uniref:group XIIA secretory phospholipase A2-like n=1 Tax=Dendronephthya gigantea TaxID=151771 RepID=UPI00106C8F35|nr:group XIIA secretory phospholipase A2-like [Dendronephthya gigantea]
MLMSSKVIIFITCLYMASQILANSDEDEDDPKKSMEALGTFFKMMSGTDKECKMSCPEGSVPLPRPGHVPSSNGCGSLGIKLDTSMFPGFEGCCDSHDKCYDTCNEDRDECDELFKECLGAVCQEVKQVRSSDQTQLCDNVSGVMQAAAVGLGCSSFNQAQKSACVCSGHAIEEDGDSNKGTKGEL